MLLYLFYPVPGCTLERLSIRHVKAYHEHVGICESQLPVHSILFLTTQVPNVHVDDSAVKLSFDVIVLSDGGGIPVREFLGAHDLHEAGLAHGTIADDNDFYLHFFHFE